FDEPGAEGFGDRLAFGVQLEFFVDLLDMKANRIDADAEGGGCSFVAVALDEEFEKAQLMRRELLLGLLWRTDFAEQFDYSPGDFRGHRGAAVNGLSQAFKQSGRRRLLKQIA